MMTKQAKEVHTADIDEDKTQVGCYAAIYGVTIAMRHFEGTTEFPNLKESTICGRIQ